MKTSSALTVVVLLFVSSICLPLAAAGSRKGSTVEVTMTDGRVVKGELLAVKTVNLIIFDPGSGKGECLDLRQVVRVRIKRDSKFLLGAIVGLVVGLRIADSAVKAEDKAGLFYGSQSALMVPMTSLLCGYIAGIASRDKKISLAGESSPAEQENLKRLKRYGRESSPQKSDYLVQPKTADCE